MDLACRSLNPLGQPPPRGTIPPLIQATQAPYMPLSPENLTHALSDLTRLRILMLLLPIGERCVCDLTLALDLPQPKISRHLAVLRGTGLLLDRRAGLWIHYRLHPDLPAWALDAVAAIGRGCAGQEPFEADRARLARPAGRGAETLSC